MGVPIQQQPSAVAPAAKPVRPSLASSTGRGFSYRSKSGHGISYRSKSGRTLTFEFTPNAGANDLQKLTALTPAKATAKAKDLSLPEHSEIVLKSTKPIEEQNPGLLIGMYESISFWCMEAVEVACWGPYDEYSGK